jgi:hypothetical protein
LGRPTIPFQSSLVRVVRKNLCIHKFHYQISLAGYSGKTWADLQFLSKVLLQGLQEKLEQTYNSFPKLSCQGIQEKLWTGQQFPSKVTTCPKQKLELKGRRPDITIQEQLQAVLVKFCECLKKMAQSLHLTHQVAVQRRQYGTESRHSFHPGKKIQSANHFIVPHNSDKYDVLYNYVTKHK